jgi:hypothetical protein
MNGRLCLFMMVWAVLQSFVAPYWSSDMNWDQFLGDLKAVSSAHAHSVARSEAL